MSITTSHGLDPHRLADGEGRTSPHRAGQNLCKLDCRASYPIFAAFDLARLAILSFFKHKKIRSVSGFDTDVFDDTDSLINDSHRTATRFFSADKFRMRLAAHLLCMKCREQQNINK